MIKTIDDVIEFQTAIVAKAIKEKARFGYFACLYLKMTKALKNFSSQKKFQDADRMEQLCINFAKRYLQAFTKWQKGEKPTESWALAFEATQQNNISVLQHLICGINAHINLDLGIAAAQTSPGNTIILLKPDFEMINDIIASLMNKMKDKLHRISWPIRFIDEIGKNYDDDIANFSICIARDEAWKVALDLADLPETGHKNYIENLDKKTSDLAKLIINPGVVANFILKPVKWFEPSDPVTIIEVLNSDEPST